MSNADFLNLLSIVFILVGGFSFYNGRRRMRQAAAQGQKIKWYTQINILLGLEYVLIALVFMTSTLINNKNLPPLLSNIIYPIYLVLLASSAVLAVLVIRQAFFKRGRPQTSRVSPISTSNSEQKESEPLNTQQRTIQAEHRRERRQKAAAARRRRAGKA